MDTPQHASETVLIVDDDQNSLDYVKSILENAGYAVVPLSESGKALSAVKEYKPDIVLLDVLMPGIDGYDVCALIHAEPGAEHIPVIFLTAKGDPEDIVRGFEAGAVDYLTKPINNIELIGRMRNHLERRRYERSLSEEKDRFRILTESVGEAFIQLDEAMSHIIYTNPAFERIFGTTLPTLPAPFSLLNALIHPQDLDRFVEVIGTSIATKTGFNSEFRIRRPDGTIRWVWARANIAETGSARNAICVVEDITDRKVAEIQLIDALENEKDLAGTIQHSLLMNEENVQVPGIDSTLVSIPSTKIDGDFLDMYSFGLVLDVVVGDVMGKGIHAALIGAGAKTRFLRAHAKLGASCSNEGLPSPAQIVEEVDRGMAKRLMSLDTFFTVQYMRFAREDSYFEYVDCGHTPIIIWDGEACWAYKGPNPPIGFIENQKFSSCRIPLRPGNLVLVYSDGATEAGTQESGQFGEERLFAAIRNNVHLDTDALVKQLLREIEGFSDGKRSFDDLTLAAFRVKAEPSPPPPSFRIEKLYAADLNMLEDIRERVRGTLELFSDSELGEDARYLSVLAASEAATNVIVHGLGKVGSKTFTLCMEGFKKWYYIAFRYQGTDFNWARVRTPSVLAMDEQGYGLYIVKNAMNSIVYTRSDNGLIEMILSGELRG